jgi:3-oxoacyl-[acyl-carrier protein] reductase
MDLGLRGKVAVVLAASSGLGRGTATVLAREGCDLAICAREPQRLEEVAKELRRCSSRKVIALSADVSELESLDSFFDKVFDAYNAIDILVTNAGGPLAGRSLELSDEQYLSAYNLTLMSVVRSCRRVVPSMTARKWGRIVNVASTSVKCAMDNMVLSNVFRSSVAAFSKTLANEYAREGIRIHTVMPGPFVTNRMVELGNAAARQNGKTFEQWKVEAENSTALGRFGDPEEFGSLVAFLVSNCSDYMTGTCMAIDGGVLKTIS